MILYNSVINLYNSIIELYDSIIDYYNPIIVLYKNHESFIKIKIVEIAQIIYTWDYTNQKNAIIQNQFETITKTIKKQ